MIDRTLTSEGGSKLYTTMITHNGLPAGRGGLFTGNTGPHAGSVSVNLVPRVDRPFSDAVAAERVRSELRDAVPGTQLYFFTGGIVKRILNFGSEAPIDVEILGYDLGRSRRLRPQDPRSTQAARVTSMVARCSPTCRSAAKRTTPSSTWSWIARRRAPWA